MPMTTIKTNHARAWRRSRDLTVGVVSLVLAGSFVTAPASAARESVNFSSPFEVSDSPAGNYLAAMVAGADHDTVAAATFFREALRFDPRNPSLIERAFVAALSNGNMFDAFTLSDRLISKDPSNSLGHLTLGIKALKAKQYAAARSQLAKGGAGGQARDITATLIDAWTFVGSNDEKKALEFCDRLRDDNFAVFRNFHAGLIADVMGDTAEASKRLKAAYDADKNTLRLVDAYGRFVSRHGTKDDAIKIYTDFDAVLPNHPIIVAAIADLKAGKTLEPLVKTADQGAAEVLYGLGAAGGRQGDEVAAMIYLRLALYLAPQNGLTLITLADIYDRLKQYEQAIAIYQSVPDNDVLRTTADIQIAQLMDNLEKHDESAKYLGQIVAAHPNDEDALLALGNSQRVQKKFPEAIETYTKALAVSTKPEKVNWPLFYFRGISYERAKMWPKAEADFRKGLVLFPDQPLILNYLGYSFVDQGMNLDEAFKMLHKAVELRPSDGYVVDSLGWALFKLGKYDEAVKELERAIDLKPGDPTINDHLGDAYWKIGRKLEAHFQWNH
ncbi:tetratricopeptide repeat protein, partial [Beijerinckia sp. L45]|uniref:tetratricopeptide repeat protein n=1 Tax=Beijerinckia sp. L45 TaxID=1641855 RepID=UPI001FF000D9